MTTDGPDSSVSYGRRLSDLAEMHPAATAFIFVTAAGDELAITWRELDLRSNRVARALEAQGVGLGDMVVIEQPNSPLHVVSSFATWKVGGCVLPLRWDLPAWERTKVLAVAEPAVVVSNRTDPSPWPVVAPEALEDAARSDEPLPDRISPRARAIASSGSTGVPKVICGNAPGVFNPASIENSSVNALGQHAGQIQLVPAPFYHTNGSLIAWMALLQGQSLIVMERFVADLALDLIERHAVNTLTATTIMLQRMARSPLIETRDLTSVESMLHGAAPLPQWLAHFWIDRVGPTRFFQAYGSSENAGTCFVRGDEWLERPGTVGRPVDTELSIRDDEDREVPPGQTGMIHLRRPGGGDPVFTYLGDVPPATGADGYTALGDLGWLDHDGYLYLADRRIDMIISGGANVYPAEVEGALTEHVGVADAVVVGLPDDEWGERVHAVVQPTDIAHPPSVEELRTHCRERLAAYKVPKTVEIVDRLPRNEAGKIRRGDLARERAPE